MVLNHVEIYLKYLILQQKQEYWTIILVNVEARRVALKERHLACFRMGHPGRHIPVVFLLYS